MKSVYRKGAVFFLLLLTTSFLWAQTISSNNWITHPDIVEIRGLVDKIEKAISQGLYPSKKLTRSYSGPGLTLRQGFYDKNNNIRKFIQAGGSDDSAATYNFYYDAEGKLRFVFITAGAVNGTVIEHRIYFDDKGRRIWEIQKLLEGPGYTFPEEWPGEDLILDASKISLTTW